MGNLTIGGYIDVCVDCMVIAVNGEPPVDRLPSEPSVWSLWRNEPYHIVPAFGSDDMSSVPAFSKQACEGCGSTLAGQRYRFAWLEQTYPRGEKS